MGNLQPLLVINNRRQLSETAGRCLYDYLVTVVLLGLRWLEEKYNILFHIHSLITCAFMCLPKYNHVTLLPAARPWGVLLSVVTGRLL